METDLEHQGLFSKFKNFNRRTRKYMTRIMQEHNVQQSEYPTNVYSIIFLFVIIRLPFQFRYYSYRTAGIIHYFLLFVARILPQKFSPLVGVNPECFSEIFRRFDDRCSLRIYPNKSYSFVEFSDISKAIAAYNDLNGIRPFSERLPPTTMFFIIGGQYHSEFVCALSRVCGFRKLVARERSTYPFKTRLGSFKNRKL